jgi:type I restriction-modification system DNA methylase subunit
MGLAEGLLDDSSKRKATYLGGAADPATKAKWAQEATRLVRSHDMGRLEQSNERSLQGAFLDSVFVRLLGYEQALSGSVPYTLKLEESTEMDATKPDGALGWFGSPAGDRVDAVIELKGARTGLDQRQLSHSARLNPVDQAFLYASKFTGCKWVLVSNFVETRLYSYAHGQRLYESFHLRELTDPDRLLEFVSLLRPSALIGEDVQGSGYLERLLVERPAVRDRDITQVFYDEYIAQRDRLLQHFLNQRPAEMSRHVVRASQKLIDRILFICFAEDTGTLLPTNLLRNTANIAQQSRSRSPNKIWDELRELFRDIDEGRPDVTPPIPAYNGGLFARDELLDTELTISDGLALELVSFGEYDYRNTINVEILGHVFEQSISDLESLHRIHSLDPDAVEAGPLRVMERRRAAGVYYTPRWVTTYIVESTVGQAAADRRFDPEGLAGLKVVDPACGSGAFLAQTYRHLVELAEATVKEALPLEQRLLSEATPVVRASSYLNGLRGVDFMGEAVEIARLSLWLASANPDEQLHSLDGIREGNTLLPASKGSVMGELFPKDEEGGPFDVCVGNPPWGATIDYPLDPTLELARGQFDTYELFIERGIRDVIKDGGYFGFVIPDRLLRPEGERSRRWLFDNFQVQEVIKLGEGVFPGVARASVILIVRKVPPTPGDSVRTLVVTKADRQRLEEIGATQLRSLMADRGGSISRSRIVEDPSYEIPLGATDEDIDVMAAMKTYAMTWTDEGGIFDPYGRGVETGTEGFVVRCNSCFEWQTGPRRRSKSRGGGYEPKVCDFCGATFTVEEAENATPIIFKGEKPPTEMDQSLPGDGWKRIYVGEDVSRYRLSRPAWVRAGVPNVNYKPDSLYASPKLLIRQAGVGVNAAVDESDALALQSVYVYRMSPDSGLDPYYVLGLLCSRSMLYFFHRLTNQTEWQSFPKLVHRTLQRLPLADPKVKTSVGRKMHDEIASLARERMGRNPAEEAHDLDLHIERLVMEAFGLSNSQRQRVLNSLRSVQRLQVIREMFPRPLESTEALGL